MKLTWPWPPIFAASWMCRWRRPRPPASPAGRDGEIQAGAAGGRERRVPLMFGQGRRGAAGLDERRQRPGAPPLPGRTGDFRPAQETEQGDDSAAGLTADRLLGYFFGQAAVAANQAYDRGDMKTVEYLFELTVLIQPQNSNAWLNLACVHSRLGGKKGRPALPGNGRALRADQLAGHRKRPRFRGDTP